MRQGGVLPSFQQHCLRVLSISQSKMLSELVFEGKNFFLCLIEQKHKVCEIMTYRVENSGYRRERRSRGSLFL